MEGDSLVSLSLLPLGNFIKSTPYITYTRVNFRVILVIYRLGLTWIRTGLYLMTFGNAVILLLRLYSITANVKDISFVHNYLKLSTYFILNSSPKLRTKRRVTIKSLSKLHLDAFVLQRFRKL